MQIVKMLIHLSTVEPGENCKSLFSTINYHVSGLFR